MLQLTRQRYASLWTGLFIVLLLGLSLYFEVFNRFDRWIYDAMTVNSSADYMPTPKVLLVELEADYGSMSVADWFELLAQINQHKPIAIAINIRPWNWTDEDVNRALQQYPLLIGVSQAQPNQWQNKIALSATPPLDGLSHRQQYYQLKVHDKYWPVLESAVAAQVLHWETIPDGKYFINFTGGLGRLPLVTSQRVQEAGLVDALVKNRAVLIGIKTPLMMDISSPLGRIPYASYQAYALDTLLNQNRVQLSSFWQTCLLLFLLVFILLLWIPRIADKYQLMLVAGVFIATLVVSYIGLLLAHYWILPGYLLLAEFSVQLALLFIRNHQNQQALQSMALNSASRIESHWLSESFYSSEAHWNYVANMVAQTLSLERTIFLERVPNDHRIREVKALNCSLDDIDEMRRDYQRTPYTSAIEQGGALRLTRTYLQVGDENEVQYLVPLAFAGNILGFWAFSILPANDIDEKRLIEAVEQFAVQISELLYHRAEWEKSQQAQHKLMSRLLAMNFEEGAYDSIQHSMNFMSHRISVMESLMDGLKTSAILYDLFGRVIHVNNSMTQMLSEINLQPYSMTAVDLIVALSDCNMQQAREYLSYLILEQGGINLPVKHQGLKTGFMMMISALKSNEDYEEMTDEVRPFEMTGILCELIDMSQIREIYSQKEKIVKHMTGWLRNDLSSISMACELAEDSRLSTEKHKELMQLIKTKVSVLGKNFEKVNSIVQEDLVSNVNTRYPVDYTESLDLVIKDIEGRREKSVKVEKIIPFSSPLVLASPKELHQVFMELFRVLYMDALEDSCIKLSVAYDLDKLEFIMENQGFGIPQEQLQGYLETSDSLENEEYQGMRAAAHQIINWGGEFSASSVIGEGMRFKFSLQIFNLQREQ